MKRVLILAVFFFIACSPSANDIGRQSNDGYEQRRKAQEDLLRRQQEVIKRQEKELEDLERQRQWDNEFRIYNPRES